MLAILLSSPGAAILDAARSSGTCRCGDRLTSRSSARPSASCARSPTSPATQAFEMLSKASQRTNVKLRDLAEQIAQRPRNGVTAAVGNMTAPLTPSALPQAASGSGSPGARCPLHADLQREHCGRRGTASHPCRRDRRRGCPPDERVHREREPMRHASVIVGVADRPTPPPPGPLTRSSRPRRTSTSAGASVYLRCWGETVPGEPTILLLSGLGPDTSTWALMAPDFASEGHHLCAYDRLGVGRSDPAAGGPSHHEGPGRRPGGPPGRRRPGGAGRAGRPLAGLASRRRSRGPCSASGSPGWCSSTRGRRGWPPPNALRCLRRRPTRYRSWPRIRRFVTDYRLRPGPERRAPPAG